MIAAVAGLLVRQRLGEVLVRALGMPLPSPVALGLNGAMTALVTPLIPPALLRVFGGS